MALINKIREKSGIAVTVIAVSLIFFIVGGDLLGGQNSLFGGNSQTIGEISGKEIQYADFQQQVESYRQNYEAQTGRSAGEQELVSIREQAWNQLIVDLAYSKEFEKLGLSVNEEELVDMVQGNHISPAIQQAFGDPNTGAFDKAAVINYLKNLSNLPIEQQRAWTNFESSLKENRVREKYENLLRLSSYVTKAEAEKEYIAQNSRVSFKYLYVPFYAVPDSTIKVSDSELAEYLKAHKDEYKGVDTRTIEYVSFPIRPAKDDSSALYTQIKDLAKGLASAENSEEFARINSEVAIPSTMSLANMSEQLKEAVKTFVPGGVYGPYREDDTYYIYKYGGTERDSVHTARASHILIRPENQSDSAKAVAKAKAEGILNQIRGGASFEALAATNSADGSAQRGGDLGYFQNNGTMVKPFEDAVFSMNSEGLVGRIVESQFGYHIIKVTDAKSNILYKIAGIGKIIAPSQATRDEAYRKADEFAHSVKNKKEFDEAVSKDNSLIVATANRITESATNINAIPNAREIVRWAFSDKTSLNKVSQVFETDEHYVVAVLTGRTDKDDVKVDDFRDQLSAKVRNQAKGKKILETLNGISESDFETIAKKYGAGALVENAENLSLATGFLNVAGYDPYAMGKAFGLKQGQKSKSFVGENGVFIIEVTAKEEAPMVADHSQQKNQLQQGVESRSSYMANEVIRENANIKDNRARFY